MSNPFKLYGLIVAVLLSACATPTNKVPNAYTGADNVEAVNPADIVGTWDAYSLNPRPNEPQKITRIRYSEDGTLLGRMEIKEDPSSSLGNLKFRITGIWEVDSGYVRHSNIEMKDLSGNEFGAVFSAMINRSSRNVAGTANVYELSNEQMIWVGTDGVATLYERAKNVQ